MTWVSCALRIASVPNKGLELTAYSVRSCVAPASSRSSGPAFGFAQKSKTKSLAKRPSYSGKQMETPKYYECMNPVLTALREGGGTLTNEEIVDAVANIMHLPDDVMNRKQQGHNMGEVEYRVAWAKS